MVPSSPKNKSFLRVPPMHTDDTGTIINRLAPAPNTKIIHAALAPLHGLDNASPNILYNIKRQYYKPFICYPQYFKSNIVRIIQGKSVYRATVLGKRRLRVGINAPT